MTDFDP
jgi:hypothetical protein